MSSFKNLPLNVPPPPPTSFVRYMDSKKLPLWLVFENRDPLTDRDCYIMFKSGDDLRQVNRMRSGVDDNILMPALFVVFLLRVLCVRAGYVDIANDSLDGQVGQGSTTRSVESIEWKEQRQF